MNKTILSTAPESQNFMKTNPATKLGIALAGVLALSAISTTCHAATLADGLVAHYELDGNALDSSGNGANGTIYNNVVPTTDRFGVPNAAMYFPANFDAIRGTGINVANSSSSISLWVDKQYLGNLVNGSWILRVGDVGANGKVMHVALDYGQSIRYSFWNDTFDINSPILPFDEWHHLAFTFDDTINQQKIYVDGSLAATRTAAYGFSGNTTFEFGNVNMKMDDIRFYNRVLSPTEVTLLQITPEPSSALLLLGSALPLLLRRRRAAV